MERILNGTHIVEITCGDDFRNFMHMCDAIGLKWCDGTKCTEYSLDVGESLRRPLYLGAVKLCGIVHLGIYSNTDPKELIGKTVIPFDDFCQTKHNVVPLDLASIF